MPITDNSATAAYKTRRSIRGRGRSNTRTRGRPSTRSASRGRGSTSTSYSSSNANTLADNRDIEYRSNDNAKFEAERLREAIGTKISTTLRKHNKRPNLYTI